MVQQTKQCAGCGAQMGAKGRVCPRCGRGSLFGELVWIAVLGMLLLAIGVLSGLVPMERIAGLAGRQPMVQSDMTKSKVATPARASSRARQPRPQKVAKAVPPDATSAYAPCSGTDTYALRPKAKESLRRGPHAPAASPCREAWDSANAADHGATLDTIAPSR